jgi:hypothetical protein
MRHNSRVLPPKVEANERIHQTQAELGIGDSDRLPFLCECDDVRCHAIVRLTRREYQTVRSAGRCLIAQGHAPAEKVAFEGNGYAVIEG